jgi:2,3,4,5-tetrahydropyridine-2-carboxylate N-succinyltransferase
VIISIGESCLLGANSGLGIPLGDRCTIESGLYVTRSSKVQVIENGKVKETVKAMVLAHKSDLLFIRNSITGAIECRDNRNVNELNEDLHDNN